MNWPVRPRAARVTARRSRPERGTKVVSGDAQGERGEVKIEGDAGATELNPPPLRKGSGHPSHGVPSPSGELMSTQTHP